MALTAMVPWKEFEIYNTLEDMLTATVPWSSGQDIGL